MSEGVSCRPVRFALLLNRDGDESWYLRIEKCQHQNAQRIPYMPPYEHEAMDYLDGL